MLRRACQGLPLFPCPSRMQRNRCYQSKVDQSYTTLMGLVSTTWVIGRRTRVLASHPSCMQHDCCCVVKVMVQTTPPSWACAGIMLWAGRTRARRLKVLVVAVLGDVRAARLALALARAQLVRQQELAAVELVQQQHLDALRALPLRAARIRDSGALTLPRCAARAARACSTD